MPCMTLFAPIGALWISANPNGAESALGLFIRPNGAESALGFFTHPIGADETMDIVMYGYTMGADGHCP